MAGTNGDRKNQNVRLESPTYVTGCVMQTDGR